jgi:DNA invertase Pin-like site-specific DNA recombinase
LAGRSVGEDKDSERWQRAAVEAYAKAAGIEIVEEFYDAAVSGADPVHERPGFAAMLARIEGNGVRAVLVETSSRFARDILVQETGWRFLKDRGIDLISADSPTAFLDETPTAIMVRQLLGVISQFEKASLVARLKGARQRQKRLTGKCEGRKSATELNPAAAELAKKLHRKRRGQRMSLRAIAVELAAQGYVSSTGQPLRPSVVQRMIEA